MTLGRIGRISKALVVSVAVGLGMTACGGGTIGFLWVLGTQYNQIAGFQIDDRTGNLTSTVNSPYSSGGTNPVSIAVKPGGRFVFVVNSGGGSVSGNVAEFSVDGSGVLTFEQTYATAGKNPLWAATDSTGNYLYVLDQVAPDGSGNGDLNVFSIDSTTGRLAVVPGQAAYFEVGPKPTTFRVGGSCLYTLDTGDQSIFTYSVGSGGQLTANPKFFPAGAVNLTSLNFSGNGVVYLTDTGYTGSTVNPPVGTIWPYVAGSGCSLSLQPGGGVANLPLTANPSFSLTDAHNRFLYVLNQSNTNSNNAGSTISAYSIDATTNLLVPLSDTSNPYSAGNGPVCMVEDPSNQYLYLSNRYDGTVTGKFTNATTGQLSNLSRGSTFTAIGLPSCLALSGAVD